MRNVWAGIVNRRWEGKGLNWAFLFGSWFMAWALGMSPIGAGPESKFKWAGQGCFLYGLPVAGQSGDIFQLNVRCYAKRMTHIPRQFRPIQGVKMQLIHAFVDQISAHFTT